MRVYRKYDKNLGDYTVIKTTSSLKERVDDDLYTPTLFQMIMSNEELAARILKELTKEEV